MIIGFKEWLDVCAHLGAGTTSLLLRKGGIHEGRSGFYWKHDAFFLFPTRYHEQSVQFPWPGGVAPECGDDDQPHTITLFATVEEKLQLGDRAQVERLRPFHFWTDETIRDRFDYTEHEGISLAVLRVWRLEQPWTFPHQAKYGGCRSWLDLPEVPRECRLSPVMSDSAHAARLSELRTALAIS